MICNCCGASVPDAPFCCQCGTPQKPMTLGALHESWKKVHYRRIGKKGIEGYETAWRVLGVLADKPVVSLTLEDYQTGRGRCRHLGQDDWPRRPQNHRGSLYSRKLDADAARGCKNHPANAEHHRRVNVFLQSAWRRRVKAEGATNRRTCSPCGAGIITSPAHRQAAFAAYPHYTLFRCGMQYIVQALKYWSKHNSRD